MVVHGPVASFREQYGKSMTDLYREIFGAAVLFGMPGQMPFGTQGMQMYAPQQGYGPQGMQPGQYGPQGMQPGQPGQYGPQGMQPGRPGQYGPQGMQSGQPGQYGPQGMQPGQPGQAGQYGQQGTQPGQLPNGALGPNPFEGRYTPATRFQSTLSEDPSDFDNPLA